MLETSAVALGQCFLQFFQSRNGGITEGAEF